MNGLREVVVHADVVVLEVVVHANVVVQEVVIHVEDVVILEVVVHVDKDVVVQESEQVRTGTLPKTLSPAYSEQDR
jgi:hypothetical protein